MKVFPMSTIVEDLTHDYAQQVRLVYHYRDGHDFTTETMLRAEALAYIPLLRATRVGADQFEATFATIEMRSL
jgi:hypothetical protein